MPDTDLQLQYVEHYRLETVNTYWLPELEETGYSYYKE